MTLASTSSFGAERLHRAARHHQHLVEIGERRRAVRDHDDDAAALAHALNGGRQRDVAVGVEIGIGLVEHHQERIAVERPRQPDQLPLSGRECRAAVADPRLEAVRQAQDHLVDAGRLGRREDGLRIGVLVEAADVFGNRAVEQFDVLRQIADVAAERLDVPLLERRLVEADRAAQRRPGADEGAHQRRLAGRARPDHAQPGTRLEREGDVLDERLLLAGCGDRQRLDRQRVRRPRQRHRLAAGRQTPSASSTAAHSSGGPT